MHTTSHMKKKNQRKFWGISSKYKYNAHYIILFYFLNYHIALKHSLTCNHNQIKYVIEQQLSKKGIFFTGPTFGNYCPNCPTLKIIVQSTLLFIFSLHGTIILQDGSISDGAILLVFFFFFVIFINLYYYIILYIFSINYLYNNF